MAIDDLETLFPEIDPVKTARTVATFFRWKLPKYERMAGYSVRTSLHSPVIDGMPKSPSFNNSAEDAIVEEMARKRVEWAQRLTASVPVAISQCSVHSQRILIGRFIQHQSDLHIWQDVLHCDRSEYYRKRQFALNEFADTFQAQKTFYDLHEYKNETNVRQNGDEAGTH